ncbi:C69 family dipeptidase [Collinsella tanakaei]|uniref:C69 family dipeptidase n=1 Tax=Collinsella tanakaei TaxID=626935 RepID=UPI0025A3BA82|nr:C69 family dipeptidase [Collinsella tanakaei]MDM8301545.1 C69 family dipeptidase [Collinsella tanakaei]
MPCTTILVGRNASYDGSTIVARNEDSPGGQFEPKRMAVVHPEDQPRVYTSVESHLTIELPDDPMRYTSVPDALPGHGIWAEAGFNEANVGMSATETITSNDRVLGADPLVEYVPAQGKEGEEGYVPAVPGGLGEEDLVTVVLPYIRSAREGVERLGALLERYGTYEMNGIAFSDVDEIWWLETVGGHHWIAKRVPDDAYVTMPNQLGIDYFDLADAEGEQVEHMASADLRTWMEDNHLNLTMMRPAALDDMLDEVYADMPDEPFDDDEDDQDHEDGFGDLFADIRDGILSGDIFNPREAFGSHSDSDHVYNTPRAWYMQRCLNPHDEWDGPHAAYGPEADDIPWSRVPERKVTIEDVKYVLSSHYQGTPFDPYGRRGNDASRRAYRPIGINRNGQLAVLQIRPYVAPEHACVQWMAFGCNAFNALVPLYGNVETMPEYLENTTARVTSESFYWENRIIAALADARFHDNAAHIDRYRQKIGGLAHKLLRDTDAAVADLPAAEVPAALEAANQRMADDLRRETDALLGRVLHTTSLAMKNAFSMSDN